MCIRDRPLGDSFSVSVGNDFVDARAVCLCMGARKPRLLPGEEALIGRGVSYCGTCDGLFYRGKTVAVVAQAKEAVEEANFLSNLCQKVHYFGAPAVSYTHLPLDSYSCHRIKETRNGFSPVPSSIPNGFAA